MRPPIRNSSTLTRYLFGSWCNQDLLNHILCAQNQSVWEALKKALKRYPAPDRHQLGLFVPSRHVWLKKNRFLRDYGLPAQTLLELRPLYKTFTIRTPLCGGMLLLIIIIKYLMMMAMMMANHL